MSTPIYQIANEILDIIPAACFKLDDAGNLLYVSTKAAQHLSRFGEIILEDNFWVNFPLTLGTPIPIIILKAKKSREMATCEFISPYTHLWTCLTAYPVNDGVIVYFNEIEKAKGKQQELVNEQEKLNDNKNLLQATLDATPNFTQVFEAVRNENKEIVNFKWLLQNHVSQKSSGNVIDKLLLDENPGVVPTGLFARMVKVIEDGVHQQFELKYSHEQFNGFFHQSIVKLADGVVMTSTDITDRKIAEEDRQNLNELLQTVFDTSLLAIAVMDAIYDREGNIADFKIKIANEELKEQTNRANLVDKLYTVEFPGVKKAGLFEMALRVMETGVSEGVDYFYPYENINKWFACMFVKMGDSIMVTNLNITNIKIAEQERLKTLILLEQAEKLAMIGSWDYNLVTEKMTWSDGMYRLFNMDENVVPNPEIFTGHATTKNAAIARRVVKNIKEGISFEETIDLRIGNSVKTLKLQAEIIPLDENNEKRMLGVAHNVSAAKAAREKTRKLVKSQKVIEMANQQEVFRAILSTQEEERKRIAESLHNGLGQVLYGVKLSLNQINFSDDYNFADNQKNLRQTNNLLIEAINESRRLSHQLMPKLLEDFGLEVVLYDLCEQFESIGLQVIFNGPENFRTDRSTELAMFRMIQEIILNVVKHANATLTIIKLDISEQNINIKVTDNGKGFDSRLVKGDGIGLTMLRNNLKLLGGTFTIDSSADSGSLIHINMPIKQYLVEEIAI